jgi:hypothetical protein
MAYAVLADLEAPGRFPRALTAEEIAAVPTMMEDASFLLSVKVPGLQEAIDGGNETVTTAAMLLTVAMVRRALLAQAAQQTISPGVESLSEAWGPYNRSTKYRSDNGNLFAYDSELEYLLELVTGVSATAVSIRSPGF